METIKYPIGPLTKGKTMRLNGWYINCPKCKKLHVAQVVTFTCQCGEVIDWYDVVNTRLVNRTKE